MRLIAVFPVAFVGRLLALLPLCVVTPSAHADMIIGVAGPMTGQYQSFGEQMVNGAKTAIDDINSRGGISGELLKLDIADDGCDARKAQDVAHKFVADGANLVVGHFCSNAALVGAKIYEAAGIPMIAPSSSLPRLADGAGWNVLRLASRDDAQGDFAANRINHDFPSGRIAVVDDGSEVGKNLIARFVAALGRPIAQAIAIKPEQTEYSTLVHDISSNKIDAIFLACNAADVGRIAAALKLGGISAQLFGPDVLLGDEFGTKAGTAAEGTHVSFAADPQAGPAAKAIVAAFKAKALDANGATLPSYAAVQLYAAGAVQVGPKNGRAIADWLRSGVKLETVLGQLHFDAAGDVQPTRFVWYKWSNGLYSAEIQ